VPKVLIVFAIAWFVIASGCTAPSVRSSLRQNAMAPGQAPKVLAVYMPWFGDHTHIDVGYSSQDPGVLKGQIQQARKQGISAFVVDWYGESRPYSDHILACCKRWLAKTTFKSRCFTTNLKMRTRKRPMRP